MSIEFQQYRLTLATLWIKELIWKLLLFSQFYSITLLPSHSLGQWQLIKPRLSLRTFSIYIIWLKRSQPWNELSHQLSSGELRQPLQPIILMLHPLFLASNMLHFLQNTRRSFVRARWGVEDKKTSMKSVWWIYSNYSIKSVWLLFPTENTDTLQFNIQSHIQNAN